ncbi:lipase (class 3) [Lucifera butyrica]|uniref:Lipase (Class 3) n=1 Tax=Lucifera butyrica TaxID=1351585 RepID=A0A498RDG4_9FIRM|nr:lipase family protein [Lucifera butyrica]VBB08957.1 lipase (class 3) [Lucifera butyrica]
MKRLLVVVWCVVILAIPAVSRAGALEDYEGAHDISIAAAASVAAYSDRIGEIASRYLEHNGWQIDRYVQTQGHDGARFLLAKRDDSEGRTTYILAFVGTENAADINYDLQVGKVYFDGNSIESFKANAARKNIPDTEPKVHRGFFEFVAEGLAAKTRSAGPAPRLLTDILLKDKDSKIYLTGHSLGGAAATLAGAGMISMGVNPAQIKVITFGAPAVGNAAFAAKFAPTLNLTRIVISGDPVTGVLQDLIGGYKQFGREIRWFLPDYADQPHRVTEYVDLALKNYFDKRREARQAGVEIAEPVAVEHGSGKKVYIAPLKDTLPEPLRAEFWYMQEALQDEYREKLPGCTLAPEGDTDDWPGKAAAAGYHWVVVPELSVTSLKREQHLYYITVSQTVYDARTGAIVAMDSFSTGTYNLTPLEAFIHDFKGINYTQEPWIINHKREGMTAGRVSVDTATLVH